MVTIQANLPEGDEMATTNDAPRLRELFMEELAEVQGGGPLEPIPDLEFGFCHQWMTTMACGEEGPPCPSSC
jgi:hypothetical protein